MNTERNQLVDLELRATSGPTAVSFPLRRPGPLTIGRRSANALQLNDPAVSRDHASLSFDSTPTPDGKTDGEWLLDDLGSRHGTWLNGVRLRPDRQYHLRCGDLLVVGPWTLLVVDRSGVSKPETTLVTVSDTAVVGTVASRIELPRPEEISAQGLKVLLHCSELIHGAHTEAAVIEAALDAAIAGTTFKRAAFLRPPTEEDYAEVIASRGFDLNEANAPRLSRALICQAASGDLAGLRRAPVSEAETASEIGSEPIAALCVPIMVGSTVAGFIYLDRLPNELLAQRPAAESGAFPRALARLAALGLGNIMRMDVERRQMRTEAELHSAAQAQRWLLPERRGQSGPFSYAGDTRPGKYLRGDFFDVIPLDDNRLAVVLGNVAGKGVPGVVLMSASQGFLHAVLGASGDPVAAVAGMNRLYCSRISHSRFLRLWVGVFNADERTLTYVVAGRVRAMTISSDSRCTWLATDDSRPVGVQPDAEYTARTLALPSPTRTLLLSDGFLEQRVYPPPNGSEDGVPPRDESKMPKFGIDEVEACLQAVPSGDDEIQALFSAFERHSGVSRPDHDATALLVGW